MHLLSILLFTISANIDGFTVALAYGIKKIKIKPWSNILIGIISSLGTLISMSLGVFINKFLSVKYENLIGCLLLIIIGVYFLVEFFIKENKKPDPNHSNLLDNPEKADVDHSGYIDTKECIALGIALTINNFGLGIGASISGLNVFLTTAFTFVCSVGFIILGYHTGRNYLSEKFGKFATLASALIIIILGIYEMFI